MADSVDVVDMASRWLAVEDGLEEDGCRKVGGYHVVGVTQMPGKPSRPMERVRGHSLYHLKFGDPRRSRVGYRKGLGTYCG